MPIIEASFTGPHFLGYFADYPARLPPVKIANQTGIPKKIANYLQQILLKVSQTLPGEIVVLSPYRPKTFHRLERSPIYYRLPAFKYDEEVM